MDEVNDLDNEKIKKMQEVQEELQKSVSHYRNILNYLGSNVPVQVLCLPKEIENVLIREGYLRVYDLIGHDLTKIKGLGKTRCAILESRLDDFFVQHI